MRQPPRTTGYTDEIRETLCRVGLAGEDPIHVEAWMRLGHPTLDGLCRAEFEDEVILAVACMREVTPEENARFAASFGL